jgi:hypothetical protein
MLLSDNSNRSSIADDTLTIASIAVLAFIVADIAHEGIGHGLGFYLAGGKSSMFTTTRLIEWVQLGDPQWRIFDLGGPAGNLAIAALAWLGQRLVLGNPPRLRLFFLLVMAFSLFWAFGYLIFCGMLGRGDWMALVQGTKFIWPGRILFLLLGIVLYRSTISLVAKELRWIVPINSASPDAGVKSRVSRLLFLAYLFGGLIACAGAVLDPLGPLEILKSGALSSFGAAMGLLYVAPVFTQLPGKYSPTSEPLSRGLAWIIAAAAGAIYFIWILGPGILLWFEH